MEKYPIFSGLNSLCSQNLATNKAVLPKQGNVGELLKSGELVTFDLDSKDIWLDIQVNCYDLNLVIFFEARVAKNLKIETVIKYLTEIINEILKVRRIELRYESGDAFVKKMHLSDGNIAVKNLRSTVLRQETLLEQLQAIENSSIISEIFDYLDRCLIAEFEKKVQGAQIKRQNFAEVSSEVEARMLDCMSSELRIRGLRVEEKKGNYNEARPKHRRGSRSLEMTPKVCSCEVF